MSNITYLITCEIKLKSFNQIKSYKICNCEQGQNAQFKISYFKFYMVNIVFLWYTLYGNTYYYIVNYLHTNSVYKIQFLDWSRLRAAMLLNSLIRIIIDVTNNNLYEHFLSFNETQLKYFTEK